MAVKQSLAGKTAFISGGAKRIGREISRTLSRAGVNLVIHYNESDDEALETVREAENNNVNAWALKADLTDPNKAVGLLNKALECAGKLDFLINNASIFPESQLASVGLDELTETLNINALTPFVLSRTFAKLTKTGVIINLLDTRIQRFDLSHSAYQLSKNMLRDLTKMCAIEFAPHIRVNAVAPGLILPPPKKDGGYFEKLSPRTLLKRHGCAEDIADAVEFLLRAEFVTGEIITVDGGENLKNMAYGGDSGI